MCTGLQDPTGGIPRPNLSAAGGGWRGGEQLEGRDTFRLALWRRASTRERRKSTAAGSVAEDTGCLLAGARTLTRRGDRGAISATACLGATCQLPASKVVVHCVFALLHAGPTPGREHQLAPTVRLRPSTRHGIAEPAYKARAFVYAISNTTSLATSTTNVFVRLRSSPPRSSRRSSTTPHLSQGT